MPKAKRHPDQLPFAFEEPKAATLPADLAGLEQRICSTVGTILNSDERSRFELAGKVSELLDEDVSKSMLDAYASPAREEHKVPMSRFLALVAVTERGDLLDRLLREIGLAIVTGDEVKTVRLGHLRRVRRKIDDEIRELERTAPTIRGDTSGNASD